MTILAFAGFDATSIDTPSKFAANYTQEAAWAYSTKNYQNLPTNTFWYEIFSGNYKHTTSRQWCPTYGLFDSTVVSKELWLSFAWFMAAVPPGGQPVTNITLAEFYNWNGTRRKTVADIIVDNSGATKLRIYSTAEGNNTVTYTQTLRAAQFNAYPLNTTNKLLRMDFRIVFDKVAGYVQIYNYLGVKTDEFLGRTLDSLPITDFAMNSTRGTNSYSDQDISDFLPTWVLAADESTLNMYVVPLVPKALGTHQQQQSGGLAEIAGRKAYPYQNGNINLQPTPGETKKFSVKLKDMTDKALPANYLVKAVKFAAVVDAVAATADNVTVATYLYKPSNTTTVMANSKAIVPNTDSSSSNKYQKVFSTYTTNPLTGAAWQVTDFADLEFGVSFTKA